ncbi:MAG: hypothetical protein NVV72_19860 [Asticcacaulis sp.]|nr:hypothetical protein [Asticcacaulis sp.]
MVSQRILCLAMALSLTGLAQTTYAADAAAECAANASLDTRVEAVLARADRPEGQRANDANRLSETRFVLSHIKPGDHVLDLGAGGGYESYLLSAAVCGGSVDLAKIRPNGWRPSRWNRPARRWWPPDRMCIW